MTTPIPPGMHGLIPHLVCSPCSEAMAFYKQAFGAEETSCLRSGDDQRVVHASMTIDGQWVFLADDFPEYCEGVSQSPLALGGTPVTIHRYVEDCDAAFNRAVEAGATVKMPPTDMFWGDRYAVVTDPFGHNWSIATHLREVSPEELQSGMEAAFAQGDDGQPS